MNQKSFNQQFAWQRRYLPRITEILTKYLLKEAPKEEDCEHCTDLMLLVAKDIRIGCRMRTPGFAEKYPDEFTIRSYSHGSTTELEKISDGWGDWLFYGHSVAYSDYSVIDPWWIVDLDSFRSQWRRDSRGDIKSSEFLNPDGTRGRGFKIDSFLSEPPILIGSSELCAV